MLEEQNILYGQSVSPCLCKATGLRGLVPSVQYLRRAVFYVITGLDTLKSFLISTQDLSTMSQWKIIIKKLGSEPKTLQMGELTTAVWSTPHCAFVNP